MWFAVCVFEGCRCGTGVIVLVLTYVVVLFVLAQCRDYCWCGAARGGTACWCCVCDAVCVFCLVRLIVFVGV